MRFKIIILLAMLVFMNINPSFSVETDSREYKLLLKAEKFLSPEIGMKKYWSLVKKISKRNGFVIKENNDLNLEADRHVIYLDTEDFKIKNNSYIIRCRSKKKIDFNKKIKHDLVLKYRSENINHAAQSDVASSNGYDGELKFEEDVVAAFSGFRKKYSKSNKIKIKDRIITEIEKINEIFPSLTQLDLNSKKLKIVNNRIVRELRLKPGQVLFNDVQADICITVWIIDKKIAIGEFSFDYPSGDNKGECLKNMSIARLSDRYMRKIMSGTDKWVSSGLTKTELIYKRK